VLKLNVWVDFYTKDKQTALMKASAAAKNLVMDALIAKGADVNRQDIDGNSTLHHLVKVLNKKTELALATLLKAKVNTSLKNKNGETALDLAKKINAEAVKVLVKNGIK
jgi:ankyrin repeat protein